MNINLKHFMGFFSKELDNVIDVKKLDKNYIYKKNFMLKCVYDMYNILENKNNFLPTYETFKKKFKNNTISKFSLSSSLKQLDSKVMSLPKFAKNIKNTHQANIIDNVCVLTPMMILCNDTNSTLFLESIVYSNMIDSYNHQSELLLAMFEKKSKKKLDCKDKKRFKKYVYMYNLMKKEMAKYI